MIWVGPKSNDNCPYKSEGEGNVTEEEEAVTMEEETIAMQPQAKGHQKPPETGRGRRGPSTRGFGGSAALPAS